MFTELAPYLLSFRLGTITGILALAGTSEIEASSASEYFSSI
jgi:hypothetical protein